MHYEMSIQFTIHADNHRSQHNTRRHCLVLTEASSTKSFIMFMSSELESKNMRLCELASVCATYLAASILLSSANTGFFFMLSPISPAAIASPSAAMILLCFSWMASVTKYLACSLSCCAICLCSTAFANSLLNSMCVMAQSWILI